MNNSFIINTEAEEPLSSYQLDVHPPKRYVLSKTNPIDQKGNPVTIFQDRHKKKNSPPEYFTNILKQQKKNMFVSTFLRKLKSTITLKNHPQHKFLTQQDTINDYQYELRLSKNVQLLILIILAIHAFSLLILNSMTLIFKQIDNSEAYTSFMIVSLLLHVMEMGSKFIVHFDYQQNKILKIKAIAMKYLEWQFWHDCVTLFGILMYFALRSNPGASLFFRLLIFFKMKNMLYLIEHLEITLLESVYREQVWSLIKVFLSNFIFAHVLTLMLIQMSKIQTDHNWLIYRGIQEQLWTIKYIWGYYWATTIMLTVGFGDITPQNPSEALCMVFIEMMSCIVLAYNINQVGVIIRKIRSYQDEKTGNLKIFNHISEKSEFSEQTKIRIMNYIKQSTEIRRNFNLGQEKQFIDHLPQSFKGDLLKQMNRHIWNGMMFFQNLSEQTLIRLSITIQKKLAHPEQIVYTRGNQLDILVFNGGNFGYSYNNGSSNHNGDIMQYFEVNQNRYQIASLDFLFKHNLRYDIKCVDYSVIYKLSIAQLIKILNNQSYDAEYFFMIKDKDKFLVNEYQLAECQVCPKQRHSVFRCPRLHFIALKEHVIRKNKQKYYPKIFLFDNTRVYLRKYRTLCSLKADKKKMKSAQDFVNNFLNYRSSTIISQCQILDQMRESRDNQSNQNDYQIVDGKLKIPNGNNTKFYEQAIDQIRIKLDDLIRPTKFSWDLQVDIAFNFKFYFRKYNSDEIGSNWLKRNKISKPLHQKVTALKNRKGRFLK